MNEHKYLYHINWYRWFYLLVAHRSSRTNRYAAMDLEAPWSNRQCHGRQPSCWHHRSMMVCCVVIWFENSGHSMRIDRWPLYIFQRCILAGARIAIRSQHCMLRELHFRRQSTAGNIINAYWVNKELKCVGRIEKVIWFWCIPFTAEHSLSLSQSCKKKFTKFSDHEEFTKCLWVNWRRQGLFKATCILPLLVHKQQLNYRKKPHRRKEMYCSL